MQTRTAFSTESDHQQKSDWDEYFDDMIIDQAENAAEFAVSLG